MDLALSEEQTMLRDMVRRFLDDRLDATAMACGPMAMDDWRALGELGLFAFLLPQRGSLLHPCRVWGTPSLLCFSTLLRGI